jgi:hypothetical protein
MNLFRSAFALASVADLERYSHASLIPVAGLSPRWTDIVDQKDGELMTRSLHLRETCSGDEVVRTDIEDTRSKSE